MPYFRAVERSGNPDAALVCSKDCRTHLIPAAPESCTPTAEPTVTAGLPENWAPALSTGSCSKGKAKSFDDLQMELALFQSAREAAMEAASDRASDIVAENLKQFAEAKATWLAKSEHIFTWATMNALGENGFHEYFGKYGSHGPKSGGMDAACREAVCVNVVIDSEVVESWVRDGPFPSPWRNKMACITISNVRDLGCDIWLEAALMSGALIEMTVNMDSSIKCVAEQIRHAQGIDAPVVLIGPAGICDPMSHVSALTALFSRAGT